MIHGAALFAFALFVSPSATLANESFEAIAGFRLGQECLGSKFKKQRSDVRNPADVLDAISVVRSQHESLSAGGHIIKVYCSVVDNTIHQVSLTSESPTAIAQIKESLHEKMGRVPDDSKSTYSKPERLLGVTMDGSRLELEHWNLPGNRKATAYTHITQPFGSRSVSQLKWRGGIELSYPDTSSLEWNHLKQRGFKSSKEAEASEDKERKERIKGLLD